MRGARAIALCCGLVLAACRVGYGGGADAISSSGLDSLEQIAQILSSAVAGTSAWAPLILFAASLVEYLFPPFPGDALVLAGAWYAVQGTLSWPLTFASVTAGALAGALLDYQIGRFLGPRLDRGAARRGPLSAGRLARFQAAYRRHGVLILLGNRFLPGIRAFLFIAAGAAGLPLWKVLLCGAISAMAWNALLLAVGGLVAKNLPELAGFFSSYTSAVTALLAALAAFLLLRWALRRARRGASSARP